MKSNFRIDFEIYHSHYRHISKLYILGSEKEMGLGMGKLLCTKYLMSSCGVTGGILGEFLI